MIKKTLGTVMATMSNNTLVLKSINQLLGLKFTIPSYQRGYRWDKLQVTQLLDDIWAFAKKNKSDHEFYCLQPIVVKPGENKKWEVIDGQQRLTTIKIVLRYLVENHLNRSLKEAFKREEFDIHYDTRPKSEEFLNSIRKDFSNIDFYYMWKAHESVSDWFKKKDFNDCNKFLSTLLAKEDEDNPVKVIWYEVEERANSVDIFTRLNIGKIPLTNSELIKALFLNRANPDSNKQKPSSKQLEIAAEWDDIESTLQDDSFWFFIYDKDNVESPNQNYETRIEYIFDLIKNKKLGAEKYFTFYRFLNEDFNENKTRSGDPDIETIWLNIKKYYLTLQEWYNDREFYHFIGFLITTGTDLRKLKEEAENKTKTEFKKYLKQMVGNMVDVDVDSLNYDDSKDKSDIRRVLLLFNISTLLSNDQSKSRFPFDLYKKGSWDIEHVRSQAEVELKGKDEVEWSKLVLEYYTGLPVDETKLANQYMRIKELSDKDDRKIATQLISFIDDKDSKSKFNELYRNLSKVFKEENPPSSHGIANLVLLDSETNKSYKNAFFPVKRMELMKREMKGSFVPICTKNVFMKAYSKRFDKVMYWDNSDANDYLRALKKSISEYTLQNGTRNE